jgi:hypothetical protein
LCHGSAVKVALVTAPADRVAIRVEERSRRTPVERNQSGLKVDQLVGQLVATELHSSSGFAA